MRWERRIGIEIEIGILGLERVRGIIWHWDAEPTGCRPEVRRAEPEHRRADHVGAARRVGWMSECAALSIPLRPGFRRPKHQRLEPAAKRQVLKAKASMDRRDRAQARTRPTSNPNTLEPRYRQLYTQRRSIVALFELGCAFCRLNAIRKPRGLEEAFRPGFRMVPPHGSSTQPHARRHA